MIFRTYLTRQLLGYLRVSMPEVSCVQDWRGLGLYQPSLLTSREQSLPVIEISIIQR